MNNKPHFRELGYGITEIDCMLYRPAFAASYLIFDNNEAAFIDCGTNHSIPILLETLNALGIRREQVRYVIPTHVHLDHAGGAGKLVESLPNARLLVHERGLRHMVDPSKLQASAVSVYGEQEFECVFGGLTAIPADRASAIADESEIELGGRTLKILYSPGHAKHHFCIHDAKSNGIFTGDSFGLAYPNLDCSSGAFIVPTTTPVQFDPKTWQKTLRKLLSYEPERMFLTHFGPVEEVERLADDLANDLDQYMRIGKQRIAASDRFDQLREELMDYTLEKLAAQHSRCPTSKARELLEMDINLNAQGLDLWLDTLT